MKGWHARQDLSAPAEGHGVSRRTVARNAAWAAPVLVSSVAAPAYAASAPCVGGTAKLNNGATYPQPLTFSPSTVTATISITATKADGTPATVPGGSPASFKTGEVESDAGFPAIALVFNHPDTQKNWTITLTLTFSRPVTGLSLVIADIDRIDDAWRDDVYATPGFTAVKGANIAGTGSFVDPFISTVQREIFDDDQKTWVTLKWAAAMQQVAVSYRAGDSVGNSGGGQHIGIGKFGFTGC